MCYKVVQTYQQTFKNNDVAAKEQTFRFQRVYKTNSSQKFRIKCTYFTTLTNTNRMGEIFIKGLPELNGRCNYLSVGGADANVENNGFFLGTFNDTSAEYSMTEMMLNEIPFSPFQIYTTGTAGLFLVSFVIEVLEYTHI